MRARLMWLATAGLAVLLAPPAHGQSLEQRVAAVRDGTLQMRFASRPGVCGDGRGMIGTGHDDYFGTISSLGERDSWMRRCQPGPVRVVLTREGGAVTRLRVFVGGNTPDATELGAVPARAAADYLLALARSARSGRVGEQAILASVLADSTTVWPALLPLARDHELPRATRESATFWLSRAAAAKVNGTTLLDPDGRGDEEEDDEEDVRAHAIFALSQQPHHAGIPSLIRIARTNHDPRLRSRALFWLGQSGDPRAVELFEEILR